MISELYFSFTLALFDFYTQSRFVQEYVEYYGRLVYFVPSVFSLILLTLILYHWGKYVKIKVKKTEKERTRTMATSSLLLVFGFVVISAIALTFFYDNEPNKMLFGFGILFTIYTYISVESNPSYQSNTPLIKFFLFTPLLFISVLSINKWLEVGSDFDLIIGALFFYIALKTVNIDSRPTRTYLVKRPSNQLRAVSAFFSILAFLLFVLPRGDGARALRYFRFIFPLFIFMSYAIVRPLFTPIEQIYDVDKTKVEYEDAT